MGFFSKRLPHEPQRTARIQLSKINAAAALDFLRLPPSNRLELLEGNRAGQWSMRINDQWRICFEWHDGDAYNVEIVDCH
jgi:proteic killer suppression protein